MRPFHQIVESAGSLPLISLAKTKTKQLARHQPYSLARDPLVSLLLSQFLAARWPATERATAHDWANERWRPDEWTTMARRADDDGQETGGGQVSGHGRRPCERATGGGGGLLSDGQRRPGERASRLAERAAAGNKSVRDQEGKNAW
jgi:hypothetical protein